MPPSLQHLRLATTGSLTYTQVFRWNHLVISQPHGSKKRWRHAANRQVFFHDLNFRIHPLPTFRSLLARGMTTFWDKDQYNFLRKKHRKYKHLQMGLIKHSFRFCKCQKWPCFIPKITLVRGEASSPGDKVFTDYLRLRLIHCSPIPGDTCRFGVFQV